MTIIIAVLAVIGALTVLTVFACCAAASWADDVMESEQYRRNTERLQDSAVIRHLESQFEKEDNQ